MFDQVFISFSSQQEGSENAYSPRLTNKKTHIILMDDLHLNDRWDACFGLCSIGAN